MGLEGMELIAIIVIIGLFIVVLKQFGMWEPLSLEGKLQRNRESKLFSNSEKIMLSIHVI